MRSAEGMVLAYASLVLAGAGTILFTAVFVLANPGLDAPRLTRITWWPDVLGTLLVILVLAGVHELIHAAAMLVAGARPRIGIGFGAAAPGYLYCTAQGHVFGRRAFQVITAAPVVLLTVAGLAWIAAGGPGAGWLVLPLALHLGGSMGDLMVLLVIARSPDAVRIREGESGLEFLPA